MKKELQTLKLALETAGRAVRRRFGKVGYRLKGEANLVTDADLASQKAVIGVIKKAFPEHDFLAEKKSKGRSRVARVDAKLHSKTRPRRAFCRRRIVTQ